MSVRPTIHTSLSQKLVLTPQMRQRIELLAMTKLELADMITTELSANPILDEIQPGEASDDNSSYSDDIAAIDATTADYSQPELPVSAIESQLIDKATTPDGAADVETATSAATPEREAPADDVDVMPERERDAFDEIDFGQ